MLELNKLYLMDCLEGMAQFPDKYFSLAIVDPPYGIGGFAMVRKYEKEKDVKWDHVPDNQYFSELIRISINRIVWGANYFNCFESGGTIIWIKNQPMPTFSKAEVASNSLTNKVDIFEHTWTNYVNNRATKHPTEKPIALYKWLLHNYAQPDYKIIDTHAGSCSSVIAFLDYGCDWIAFEKDEDYYKAASKRIETHKLQLKLF